MMRSGGSHATTTPRVQMGHRREHRAIVAHRQLLGRHPAQHVVPRHLQVVRHLSVPRLELREHPTVRAAAGELQRGARRAQQRALCEEERLGRRPTQHAQPELLEREARLAVGGRRQRRQVRREARLLPGKPRVVGVAVAGERRHGPLQPRVRVRVGKRRAHRHPAQSGVEGDRQRQKRRRARGAGAGAGAAAVAPDMTAVFVVVVAVHVRRPLAGGEVVVRRDVGEEVVAEAAARQEEAARRQPPRQQRRPGGEGVVPTHDVPQVRRLQLRRVLLLLLALLGRTLARPCGASRLLRHRGSVAGLVLRGVDRAHVGIRVGPAEIVSRVAHHDQLELASRDRAALDLVEQRRRRALLRR